MFRQTIEHGLLLDFFKGDVLFLGLQIFQVDSRGHVQNNLLFVGMGEEDHKEKQVDNSRSSQVQNVAKRDYPQSYGQKDGEEGEPAGEAIEGAVSFEVDWFLVEGLGDHQAGQANADDQGEEDDDEGGDEDEPPVEGEDGVALKGDCYRH